MLTVSILIFGNPTLTKSREVAPVECRSYVNDQGPRNTRCTGSRVVSKNAKTTTSVWCCPRRAKMVDNTTPRYDDEDVRFDEGGLFRRARSWSSGISSLKTMFGGKKSFSRCSSSEHGTASSFKTMFTGKKTFRRTSSSEHGTEGTRGAATFAKATTSATWSSQFSGFSDALTVTHEEVANEVDSAIADFNDQEAANNEVETVLRDCASPPSPMLLAFASVESWGGSAGAKGTDHYGAGYHKAPADRRG